MIPFLASATRWLFSGGWKWAGMGALVLAVLFFRWQAHHYEAQRDAARASIVPWQLADKINHISIDQLTAAIVEQNLAVTALTEEGERKQNAARAALRGATARAERAEVLAGRIDAERAHRGAGGQNCPSGRAVLEAKGSL